MLGALSSLLIHYFICQLSCCYTPLHVCQPWLHMAFKQPVQVSTLNACQWAVGGRQSLHSWLRGWLHTVKPLFSDLLGRWHVGRCCKPGLLIDGLYGSAFICRSFVSLKIFILMNLILVCSGFFILRWWQQKWFFLPHEIYFFLSFFLFFWCMEFHLCSGGTALFGRI